MLFGDILKLNFYTVVRYYHEIKCTRKFSVKSGVTSFITSVVFEFDSLFFSDLALLKFSIFIIYRLLISSDFLKKQFNAMSNGAS